LRLQLVVKPDSPRAGAEWRERQVADRTLKVRDPTGEGENGRSCRNSPAGRSRKIQKRAEVGSPNGWADDTERAGAPNRAGTRGIEKAFLESPREQQDAATGDGMQKAVALHQGCWLEARNLIRRSPSW